MPFMTTQELHSQRRFTLENIRHLHDVMAGLGPIDQERAVNTIHNLRGQVERIDDELAMATAG